MTQEKKEIDQKMVSSTTTRPLDMIALGGLDSMDVGMVEADIVGAETTEEEEMVLGRK